MNYGLFLLSQATSKSFDNRTKLTGLEAPKSPNDLLQMRSSVTSGSLHHWPDLHFQDTGRHFITNSQSNEATWRFVAAPRDVHSTHALLGINALAEFRCSLAAQPKRMPKRPPSSVASVRRVGMTCSPSLKFSLVSLKASSSFIVTIY